MDLSAIAWTAILLVVVILSLTFTPSCSIAFVILLGRIARAIYRNRKTTEEPSRAHLGDPRAHPRDPPCDRQGDPQARPGNGPGEAHPGDGRPGYPWAPLRDYLIQFRDFVRNALAPVVDALVPADPLAPVVDALVPADPLAPAVDAPVPVDAPAPAVDALVGAPALAVDAAGKKRRNPESSSTSSSSSRIKYEVYLNFRGSDTRKTITDHLYKALVDAGIMVFKDESELYEGEEILSTRKETINQSRISIAILSTDFASSKICLDGLVHMWDCKNLNGQIIIPIFYGISRFDVKFQVGDFGRAFDLHKAAGVNSKTIETWKEILRGIGGLPGYSENLYKGSEAELVGDVVARVVRILKSDGLLVTDQLVGINLHVEEMMRKLGVAYREGQATEVCGEDVRVVGICGMPGVGKTTLAKIVFNMVSNLFDACSFLPYVSSQQVEISLRMLIADLRKKKPAPLEYSSEGIEEIASLCCNAKVLIFLDDVSKDEQIKGLVGKLSWFGPGSRIIVTTRNRKVLKALHFGADNRGTVEVYEVSPMSEKHAHALFCEHAFGGYSPEDVPEYFSLSLDIVESIGGLPADIVDHASFLRVARDIDTWKDTLKKLRKRPATFQANYAGGSALRRTSQAHANLPLGASSPPGGAPPPASDASPPAGLPPGGDAPASAVNSPAAAGKKRKKLESSPTPSSLSGNKCDVFLSAKGTGTCMEIMDQLYRTLLDLFIPAFKYNNEPPFEEELWPEVKMVMEQSSISIAILSADYASNKSWLIELEHMWQCKNLNGQTIIPIFCGSSCSDVKFQAGNFERAFDLRKAAGVDSKTIETWEEILQGIEGLPGYSENLYKGSEAQLVQDVVVRVARILRDHGLVVTDNLVGIDLHVEEMMRKLGVAYSEGQATKVCGEDIRVVGICGVPGVGKTTLAKVVFNKMRNLFDACSFLPGFGSKQVHLSRRMLIADLQMEKPAPLESSGEGIEEIANPCCNAKVLIVLDNVDEDEQIKALAKQLSWFGPGSRIIVTMEGTMDKREVSNAFVGAYDRVTVEEHMVEPMSHNDALQLFRNHVFRGDAPEEYESLSEKIVKVIGGRPSTIEDRARLFGRSINIGVWKAALGLLIKARDYAGGSELENSIEDN